MEPGIALLFAVLVVVAIYLAGVRNPLTKCWRCGGKGVLRSWLLPWRYRPCTNCGRRGEVRGRFGGRE